MEMYKNFGGGCTNLKKNKITKCFFGDGSVEANYPYIVKSVKNRVNLNAWISPDAPVENVGDYLSYVIVQTMCDSLGISFDKEVSKTKHLYAIGSILMGYQNAVVWGSGFGYMRPKSLLYSIDNKIHKLRHSLDVRAVRGPITREILLSMGYECPEIYGDPAILLPLFFPKERTHERKYVVIPHYSKILSPEYKDKENVLGSFKKDWKEFVDCILQSNFVISSSLHGIIIAEAYGIPAVMLHDTPSQDITKYKDWYYSTNRDIFPIADSVEDALNMTPNPPDKSTLKTMQKNLLDTFPKDLWE